MNALAHPVRRAILKRVMRHETRITELAAPFDLSLNAVSKHIRVLETAGLVTRRRVWREHFVSYNPKPLDEVAAWVDQQRSEWNQRFDALDAMLKAQVAAQREQAARTSEHDPTPPTSTHPRTKPTEHTP